MTINRRSFLVLAGVGAAATACTTDTPAPVPTTTTAPPRLSEVAPRSIDYPALAARLSGPLVTPDSGDYAVARRSYNPLFDGRRPAAVAMCRRTEDVQACVTAAADSGTPIAARSGGHSYAGYSTPDGALVVDLAGLSGVIVTDDNAVVAAGTRLIDVYAQLAAAGRCLPAGSCPSVGIAGLTLGGGIGVLARKYGLTCDRLTGATVVTADGQARRVSEDNEPDLFWALRGGGGGNIGVVTSFTFATVPAPDLTVFTLRYPAGSVADAYGGWQPWLRAAPDELWSTLNAVGTSCTISGCFVGAPGKLAPLLADLARRIGRQPSTRTVLAKGYLDAMRHFAGCASTSLATCRARTHGPAWLRESFVASSRMVTTTSDPARLAAVAAGHPGLHLVIDGLGGAVGRVPVAETAFPHRKAEASIQVYLKTTTAGRPAAARQVAEVRDALAPLVGSGAYVNYIDATMPDWASAYYGANLPRLREVAQRHDPDRVFTFAQAINRS